MSSLIPKQYTDRDGNIFLIFYAGSNREAVLDVEDQRFIYCNLKLKDQNGYSTLAAFRRRRGQQGRPVEGLPMSTMLEVRHHINKRCGETASISDAELQHWAYVGSDYAETRLRGEAVNLRRVRRRLQPAAAESSSPSGSHTSPPANQLGQSGPAFGSQADAEAQNRRAHPSTQPRSSPHSQSPDSPASRAAADALIQINHEDTALRALTGLPRGDNRNYRR